MGSNIPLVALLGRPPEITDPRTIQMNAERIRALSGQNALQPGQQVEQQQRIQQNQNELKQQQLQLQQMETALQGNQAVVSAQHDPEWDASDPDQVVKIFQKYNVPLPLQGQAMKAITDMKTQMMGASKESLAMAAASALLHGRSNRGRQSRRHRTARKKRIKQPSQMCGLTTRNSLTGRRRRCGLQDLATAPPLYEGAGESWVDRQHAQLKTQASLIEEGLKRAQTAEAQGKGFQAQQEGNLVRRENSGAQAESTIQQQQAGMDPQERALAGNLFYRRSRRRPASKKSAAARNTAENRRGSGRRRRLQLRTSRRSAASCFGGDCGRDKGRPGIHGRDSRGARHENVCGPREERKQDRLRIFTNGGSAHAEHRTRGQAREYGGNRQLQRRRQRTRPHHGVSRKANERRIHS